ncbi:MAG: sulfatase [Verrucomicrobiota bacterium]
MKRLLLILLSTASSLFAAEKPNIVFILADDLGWADTTLYGHTTLYETPNLERLAARGMTFTRAYTPNPLCSPTRSAILTGKHPARTGLTAPNCHTPSIVLKASTSDSAPPHRKLTAYTSVTRLDTKYDTLAELLQNDGYTTAHFGKWHLGKPPYSPLEHGFDIDIPHWHGPGPAGSFVAPWKFPDFKEKYPQEHIEDRMGDEAVAFMEEHEGEPFFLNYWQFSVHAPFDAKADLIEKYRSKVDHSDEQRSPTYAAMVQSLDENVGKILDAIDRLGLAEQTIIVFSSDNGGNMYNEVDGTTPTSNRPLRGGKANNWEGGVRVPTVVVAPGITEPGSRSDEFVMSQDFYPTLLSLAGVAIPETPLDGIDLAPTLKGEEQDRDAVFTFFPHSTKVPDTLPPSAAAYEANWKLLRLLHNEENGAHEDLLFNLEADIGEQQDRSSEEPEIAAKLAAQLDVFLESTGAVYPRPNPKFNPDTARLSELGIQPIQNATLRIEDGLGKFSFPEANGKFEVFLKKPPAVGPLLLSLKIRSTLPGKVALRWAEEGVKPLYFKDRLAHSKGYTAGTWETVEIPIVAKKPVVRLRIDFLQPASTIDIEALSLLRGETKIFEATF